MPARVRYTLGLLPCGPRLLIPLLGLAACGLPLSGGPSVNVTRAAGLEDTEVVEIVQLAPPGSDGAGSDRVIARLNNPQEIRQLVDALDTRLPLEPPALCVENYRLRFLQTGGEVVRFGFLCDGGENILRGDQGYWKGREVRAPDVFVEILAEYID